MNAHSSALPSVNRAPSLEHLDDLAEREAVRRVLAKVRQDQGLSIRQVAEAMKCDDTMVYRLEDLDVPSYYLRFGVLFSWAAALNMAYAVELDGLDGIVTPYLEEQAAAVMTVLYGIRTRDGWGLPELSAKLGVSESTVRDLETSKNPRVSTAQRYTRALGGRLLLRPRILKPLH